MYERKRLGEILVGLQVLTPAEVERVLEAMRRRARPRKFRQVAGGLQTLREEDVLPDGSGSASTSLPAGEPRRAIDPGVLVAAARRGAYNCRAGARRGPPDAGSFLSSPESSHAPRSHPTPAAARGPPAVCPGAG